MLQPLRIYEQDKTNCSTAAKGKTSRNHLLTESSFHPFVLYLANEQYLQGQLFLKSPEEIPLPFREIKSTKAEAQEELLDAGLAAIEFLLKLFQPLMIEPESFPMFMASPVSNIKVSGTTECVSDCIRKSSLKFIRCICELGIFR